MTARSIEPSQDGLDLADPDSITPEEIAAFRGYHDRVKGASMPALEFWLEFRPDVLKRYRAGVRQTTREEERDHPLLHAMAMRHFYAVTGYEDGLAYEVKLCHQGGATKAEVLDLLAVAFIHGSPRDMRFVASGASAQLRDWVEPPLSDRWPAGWSFDPDAFRSGADSPHPTPAPSTSSRSSSGTAQRWARCRPAWTSSRAIGQGC